ncbi:MAG: 5-(carboxyamino)imidazole ribonucleotide mutase [Candidatus Humimicrobiaceae bacterium]|jgi:5-(carboxyamino)imidazole ribonucleotide mutase|nr:5-(carboxyamino)imidazole ribonucleotide mutase [Actinomycetota bacterium]MDD5601079.1 5-(carboxyamino)imidazole ribonucleotide mutase [Actinomycetota bacterium]MDY0027850.1 5-(carboxyamino)imidazole ribonucleotide mutase [Candidatus Humimicrobiaceae bacterium]
MMVSGGKKVAIVIGSISDENIMKNALGVLKEFGVEYEINVLSSHRMPDKTREFARSAKDKGIEVIIAGAGKAAHLPGVIASYTTIPVIGIPVRTPDLGGIDSLFSIVQMPSGVPVACVSIDGAVNAAILAIQILALKYEDLAKKLKEYKDRLAE